MTKKRLSTFLGVILPAPHELNPCRRVPSELSVNSFIISAG